MAMRPRALQVVLQRVATQAAEPRPPPFLDSKDVYSIAATINTDRRLGLAVDDAFMHGFRVAATNPQLAPPLSPFQRSAVDTVVKAFTQRLASSTAGSGNEGSVGGDAALAPAVESQRDPTLPPSDSPAAELVSVLKAAQGSFQGSNGDGTKGRFDARLVARAIDRAKVDTSVIKSLEVIPYIETLNAAAAIHVKDYEFAAKMARRAAELARHMDVRQACVVFSRLNQLGVTDSFTALVSQIERGGTAASSASSAGESARSQQLALKDCLNIIRGLEASTGINSQASSLLAMVLYTLQEHLDQLDRWHLIVVLDVCAKYDQRNAAAPALVLRKIGLQQAELDERALLQTLQSARSLRLLGLDSGAVGRQLFSRAAALAPTLDVRLFDQLIDLASTAPIDTGDLLAILLKRLENDAGRLHPGPLVSVIDLLASYPPAKGSITAAALATAAAMRAEGYDRDALISLVLGLAEMGYHGEDLHLLVERLAMDRQGMRTVEQLLDFLSFLTPQAVSSRRALDCVTSLTHALLPTMNAEETTELRSALAALKLDDRTMMARMKGRSDTLRREHDAAVSARQKAMRTNQQQQHPGGKGRKFSLRRAEWDLE